MELRLPIILLSLLLVRSSCAQRIAAWHNTRAAHVLVQDATTGEVYYSNCNSSGTPVFPTTPLNVFTFENGKKPKNGSAFAATGQFYPNNGTAYAQIWYQDNNRRIWQALAQCSELQTQYTVTETVEASINVGATEISESTGLAAMIIPLHGYRVGFHSSTGKVYQLNFEYNQGWTSGAISPDVPGISPDVPVGRSLSSTFSNHSSAMTMIYPLNDYSIEVARYLVHGTWSVSAFPYPFTDTNTTNKNTTAFTVDTSANVGSNALPNWSAANVSVGVASVGMNTTDQERHIFYLDTTGRLQYYLCDLELNISCSLQDRQTELIWINGTAGKDLGTAWDVDSRTIDLLYLSADQKLVMAELKSGSWNHATIITDTAIADWSTVASATSNSDSSSALGKSTKSTMSTGAVAGTAVGVVTVVLGLSAAAFLVWRRKQQHRRNAVATDSYNSNSSNIDNNDNNNENESGTGVENTTTTTTTTVNADGTTTTTIVTRKMASEADGKMISNLYEVHSQSLPPPEIDGQPVSKQRFELM